MGLTTATATGLFAAGVDVITSGNHIWDKREIYPALETDERILRPHNYGSDGVPGRGWGVFEAADGTDVAVLNFQGRTYMIPIENPFTEVDRLLDEGADTLPPVRLVDFHCEITSEKNAFGHPPRRAGERGRRAPTPTSRPPTSGSCRRGPRTRATSG